MKKAAKINPPEQEPTDADYQAHCQFALEPSVTRLLKMAEDAGWEPRQAAYAIMVLAATSVRQDETRQDETE
ncbi:hypothetical protein [Mesorhizobium xinjiangense]|uniref:hypothetical protein n=1 Tax=Mesorhizobium xinjiangense TaxID=2678685 RepID=UPI0012EE30B8|nr:hypothetical protein [Mesorhizobium xinjiangense]